MGTSVRRLATLLGDPQALECPGPFGGSSEPVGAGVVATRVASREQESRQLASKLGHMLGQEVKGCVLDARGEQRAERFKRCPCLVTAPIENGCSSRGRHRVGELGEQRGLAHPRLAAHHDAPQAGLFRQSQLGPEHFVLGEPTDERDAVGQI